MKKVMGLLLVLGFMAVNVYAAASENKKYNTGAKAEPTKSSEFWAKEGQRSGVSEWGTSLKQTAHNLNPVRFFHDQKVKYEARKAGTVVK